MFDVQGLLDQQVEGEMSTVAVPVPEGEFVAVITKIDARQWQSKDGTKSGVSLDVSWEIQDDGSVQAITGREKNIVRQSVGLDFTESNQLDMGRGRNISLGRLREAVGLNSPGKPFSFNQLPGQLAKIVVKHRAADDGTDTVYAEVKAVAKAA